MSIISRKIGRDRLIFVIFFPSLLLPSVCSGYEGARRSRSAFPFDENQNSKKKNKNKKPQRDTTRAQDDDEPQLEHSSLSF